MKTIHGAILGATLIGACATYVAAVEPWRPIPAAPGFITVSDGDSSAAGAARLPSDALAALGVATRVRTIHEAYRAENDAARVAQAAAMRRAAAAEMRAAVAAHQAPVVRQVAASNQPASLFNNPFARLDTRAVKLDEQVRPATWITERPIETQPIAAQSNAEQPIVDAGNPLRARGTAAIVPMSYSSAVGNPLR
ncbi:MAG: hypothetical protein JNL96_09925 [Planctomycetaceae bacterium]|nr:hypothetical protein [Planctomycetaceae bacterium]